MTSAISAGQYVVRLGKVDHENFKHVRLFFNIQKPSAFGQYNKFYVYMNVGLFICCLFSGVSLVYVGTIKYMMDKKD